LSWATVKLPKQTAGSWWSKTSHAIAEVKLDLTYSATMNSWSEVWWWIRTFLVSKHFLLIRRHPMDRNSGIIFRVLFILFLNRQHLWLFSCLLFSGIFIKWLQFPEKSRSSIRTKIRSILAVQTWLAVPGKITILNPD
jgi:hypothetical protein